MEQIDSFMVDSEEGLGLSYGSNKFKAAALNKKEGIRNPMEVIHDIFRGK